MPFLPALILCSRAALAKILPASAACAGVRLVSMAGASPFLIGIMLARAIRPRTAMHGYIMVRLSCSRLCTGPPGAVCGDGKTLGRVRLV